MLDFATCTECGRCQSQCPAWNTGKPLSPKLLIMGLRDNLFSSADRQLLGASRTRATRSCRSVIDPDVLWSCTTCGACVEECPVDIEHIDAIVDMRRYEVLMESRFPTEAGLLAAQPREPGRPVGARRVQADRLARRARLRGAGRHRHDPRGRRVPLLGGLRGLARRARPQAGGLHGEDAAPRRRHLRDPRAEGVVHGRPRAPDGQRVPLPGARQGEHRDAARRRARARSSSPARTASTRSATSTPRSAASSRWSTTPSCSTRSCATGASRPARRTRGPSPTTTPATSGATTASSTSRAGCSTRSPACSTVEMGSLPREGLLLRRGRGEDVDGGDDRHAGQPQPDRPRRLRPARTSSRRRARTA